MSQSQPSDDIQAQRSESNRIVEAEARSLPSGRAVGTPLPMGRSARSPQASNGPMGGRALMQAPPREDVSTMQRVMGMLKRAGPIAQRLLPLIDGNIGTVLSSFMAQQQNALPPAPPVDLAPLDDKLTDLQLQHRDLRDQVKEQNTSIKRVEDQLEMVREATDRNTLEQQELIEDLKSVGNRVKLFGLLLFGLLILSVLFNVVLFLHIRRVLP